MNFSYGFRLYYTTYVIHAFSRPSSEMGQCLRDSEISKWDGGKNMPAIIVTCCTGNELFRIEIKIILKNCNNIYSLCGLKKITLLVDNSDNIYKHAIIITTVMFCCFCN